MNPDLVADSPGLYVGGRCVANTDGVFYIPSPSGGWTRPCGSKHVSMAQLAEWLSDAEYRAERAIEGRDFLRNAMAAALEGQAK